MGKWRGKRDGKLEQKGEKEERELTGRR